MRGLRASILVLVIFIVVALFASSASYASENTVKIYYQDVQDIQADFPNGKEIKMGGELIIVTSSDIYDMEKTGIMFYKCDPDGSNPDMDTTVTPDHHSVSEGNVVRHVFKNLTTNIVMSFSDMKNLETEEPVLKTEEPVSKDEGSAGGNTLTTVVMLISAVLAAVMLAVMAMVIKMLDPIQNGSDVI
jgi:CHASE3 domain sensor protein